MIQEVQTKILCTIATAEAKPKRVNNSWDPGENDEDEVDQNMLVASSRVEIDSQGLKNDVLSQLFENFYRKEDGQENLNNR